MKPPASMKVLVWGLVLLLIVLHQDVWFWNDTRLFLGIVPITLLWHMGISLGAGITWWLATKYCWPTELEEAVLQETPQGGKP